VVLSHAAGVLKTMTSKAFTALFSSSSKPLWLLQRVYSAGCTELVFGFYSWEFGSKKIAVPLLCACLVHFYFQPISSYTVCATVRRSFRQPYCKFLVGKLQRFPLWQLVLVTKGR